MEKHNRWLAVFLVVLAVIAFGMVAYARNAMAKDVTVTLAWDADGAGVWEKLNFYERGEGGAYDYTTPIYTLPQTYVDNASTPTEAVITSTFPDGVSTTKYWVVRAAAGDLESADSDEVSFTVDLTPLPAPTYTAVFNETALSIDFSWPTGADARILGWRIFSRLEGQTEWELLEQVDQSGSVSIPLGDLFPEGERTVREFTMVAYAPFDLFSPDGEVTTITVNRRPPSGVINFRIQLVQ